MLSCLSLRFSLMHCGSFALMGAEPGTLAPGYREVNAHWTATASVSTLVVHHMPHARPPAVSSPVTFLL